MAWAPLSAAQLTSAELISRAGYESNNGSYQIVFLTDQSVLFTEIDQSAVVSAVVLDSQGQTFPTELTWELEPTALVSLVDSNASSALVRADGMAVETVVLTATSVELGISNSAQIVLAELTDEAVYVTSNLVITNDQVGMTVILIRTSETEAIQVEDILLSGDQAGVLVRVLGITLTPDQVILAVEPANITDALRNADIQSNSPQERIEVLFNAAEKSLTLRRNDEILATATPTDGLDCKFQDGSDFGLDVTGGTIEWGITRTLDARLLVAESVNKEFSLIATVALDLTATTGSLEFSSILAGTVTCELDLDPRKFLLPVRILPFSFFLSLDPSLGVEVSGSINGPSFLITGPTGTLGGSAMAGIRYTEVDGWKPVADVGWNGAVSPLSSNFDTGIEFDLNAGAFGGLELAIDGNLSKLKLASVEFAKFRATAMLDANFASPFDPNDRDYSGPNWTADGKLTGSYKAELSSGVLEALLRRLNIPTAIPITGNIFDPIEINFAHSPQIQLSVTCNPECPLDPFKSDSVDFQVDTDNEENGTVDYLASKNGEQALNQLTSSALTGGVSTANWVPQPGEDGGYDVFPRVDTDALSALFPYAPEGFQSFSVGEGEPIVCGIAENGQEPWTPLGSAEVVSSISSIPEIIPVDGSIMSLLRTNGNVRASDAEMENTFAIPSGSLDTLISGDATLGSACYRTINAAIGDTIEFSWNFFAGNAFGRDFAFAVVDGQAELLLDVDSVNFSTSNQFFKQSGWRVFRYTFTQAGPQIIAVGAIDENTFFGAHFLTVDKFNFIPASP